MSTLSIQRLLYSTCIFSALFLSACSSQIPPDVRQGFKDSPTIAKIQADPEVYVLQPVRWGGVIIDIENRQDSSRLTVVAYPLRKNGEPQVSKNSIGRFVANFNLFLEPQVYSRDRVITLTGEFIKRETIKVGEFPYNYPVIEVKQFFLWQVKEPADILYQPLRHEPYYWPYYPPHRH